MLIFFPFWQRILSIISEHNGIIQYEIMRKIDVKATYSHVLKVLNELSDKGLIYIEKKGRSNLCFLNAKGRKVADNLNEIREAVK